MVENNMITPQSMRKLLQRAEKTLYVQDELKNVCRFVAIRYVQIEKTESGKSVVSVIDDRGLQLENIVYHLDGTMSFVRSNSDLIVSVEEGIPQWADERLVSIYRAFYDRLEQA